MRSRRAPRLLGLAAVLALLAACGGGDRAEPTAAASAAPAAAATSTAPHDLLRAGDLRLAARFAVVDGALGDALAGAPDAIGQGRALWQELARLAPVGVRRELSAFAVYAPTDATNAFTRLDERGDGWIVGVAPSRPGPQLDAVLLHELAHVATLGPDEVDQRTGGGCDAYLTIFGCARPTSCIQRFVEAFWDPARGGSDPAASTRDRFRAARGAFLGPYAASLPEEDIVITWVARVTGHGLPGEVLRAKAAFLGSCPTLAALERALPRRAS